MKFFRLVLCLLIAQTTLHPANAQENNPLINSGELLIRGSALYDSGSYKQSIELYRRIDRNDTNYTRALYETSLSYYADSQFNEAIRYCQMAFAIGGDPGLEPDMYNEYGNAIDAGGDPEKALLVFDSAILKYPAYALLYMNKGTVLLKLKRDHEAELLFQKALLIDPYSYSCHFKLGIAALRQGKLIPAMLSFIGYLLVNPEGRYQGSCINLLSSIAKNEDDIQAYVNNRKETPADNYQLLEQIVQSKIALDSKYKPIIHLDDAISRQIQVVFEKMEYEEGNNDFWVQYYMPFYREIFAANRFEVFINHLFAGVNVPEIRNFIKKNKKEVQALTSDAAAYFNLIRGSRELNYKKRNMDSTAWFFSDGVLLGKGQAGDNGNRLFGPWEFYFSYGNIKGKGLFNPQGKKEGPWNYYYADGKLKGKEFYQEGKQEGEETYYFTNGLVSSHSFYKNNLPDGESTTWYLTGCRHIFTHYVAGKEDGEKTVFYTNGNPKSTGSYKAGQEEGIFHYWLENGTLESTTEYRDGKQEGSYKKYFANGRIAAEGAYSKDKQEGPWKYYFESGKLKETQIFVNDKQEGDDKEYYENGQLYYSATFKKGKVQGGEPFYDEDGKQFSQLFFENDKLKSAKYMDKNGQVISESETRQRQIELNAYDEAGVKTTQTTYNEKGNATGKKTYFYPSGGINETEEYKDGDLDGLTLDYFADGAKKQVLGFSGGQKDGYCQNYYDHGQMKAEGWYAKNQAQGYWLYYNELGALTDSIYYADDEMNGYRAQFLPNGRKEFETKYRAGWLEETTEYDSTGKLINRVVLPASSGKYTLIYPGGATYLDANYVHGNLEGPRKTFYFDGKPMSEEYFKKGLQDSSTRNFYHSGIVELESWYHLGDKTGAWKFYSPDGKLKYTEEYKEGKLNGKRIYYYDNGSIDEETHFKDDEKDGTTTRYDLSGALIYQLTYKEDKPVSYTYQDKTGHLLSETPILRETAKIKTFFANGTLSAEFAFRDGYSDGAFILYYPDGKVRSNSVLHYGLLEGPLKTYHANGQLNHDYTYLHDNLHGHYKEYNEKGILTEEGDYYNGNPHGIIRLYDDNGKLIETDLYYYDKFLSVKK